MTALGIIAGIFAVGILGIIGIIVIADKNNFANMTDEEFVKAFAEEMKRDFRKSDQEWQATNNKKIIGYWKTVDQKQFERIKYLQQKINEECKELQVIIVFPDIPDIYVRNIERYNEAMIKQQKMVG